MSAHEDEPLTRDAPQPPGTPEPPDLDVDAEQFLDDDERRARREAGEDAETEQPE
ncbi:hypothetical protein [Umezawaea beigongshangensis]|uniref:hypothetical protein n=1 Tax=Umezawaea beigongshangensis TaxID=2780383 RepID=UPI0018F1E679|nr:hypothetical protein [Umezawaea beigongshangensis]